MFLLKLHEKGLIKCKNTLNIKEDGVTYMAGSGGGAGFKMISVMGSWTWF